MKYVFLWAVLLICTFKASAQTNPSARPKLVFEKTYLHTDRDVYAQGDTLWFKAYLVNAQDNTPINSSNNLHVELISRDAKILSSELIRLDNGLGNGDMELVDSLPAGKYRLRAYTNWMRNFGDNFIFDKDITILNTDAVPIVAAQTEKGKSAKPASATTTKPSPATKITATVNSTVRFYPEGGSLVEGISSLIAVKAEDGAGKGIPLTGVVLSASGDTVSKFTCDTLGMGLFALLPVKGQVYHAVVNSPAGSPRLMRRDGVFDLPVALSTGLALQIRQSDSLIRAVISSNNVTALTCKLTVKHGGITLLSQTLQVTGQVSVKVATAGLPEGISAITLYDGDGKPNCERLVYVHHPNSNPIVINTNKKVYSSKEQVNVQINARPNTSLSMAVVDAGIVPEQSNDIVSYLMLGSEIKGHVEQARRYFDTTNVNRFKQLDLLLMTQGWRDFVWRRMADTSIRISYAAESGVNVSGKVWDEVRNKYMPNLNLSLYANEARGNKLYPGVTDSLGRFNFTGLLLFGKQNIKLASVNDKGNKKGTFLVDTILPMPVKQIITYKTVVQAADDSVTITAIEKRVTAMKSAQINGITKLKEVSIKASQVVQTRSGPMMTWGPDQVFDITPKDYEYRTLEWFLLQNSKGAFKFTTDPNRMIPPKPYQQYYPRLLSEYLRPLTGVGYSGIDTFEVNMGSLGGSSGYRYIAKNKIIPPQLIVNGQELYMDEYHQAEAYRNIYFYMPLNKFKRIVLKHVIGTLHSATTPALAETIPVDRYFLYLTLTDDALTDNPGSKSVDITGYYEARTFYQPPPGVKASINDYRTTIHWEPNITTNEKGEATVSYYNADPKTHIKIFVEGITTMGEPLSAAAGYEIK